MRSDWELPNRVCLRWKHCAKGNPGASEHIRGKDALDEGDHAAAPAGLLAATWGSPLNPLPSPAPRLPALWAAGELPPSIRHDDRLAGPLSDTRAEPGAGSTGLRRMK